MQIEHKYIEYSVENFINLITQKKLKKENLITIVKNIDVNEELISKTLQRIDFAYKRINEPLENNVKYLLLIFPFGIVNRFNLKGIFNVEENKRLGFVKKIEEYKKYSSIGLILYIVIITILIITFFLNK